MDRQVKTIEMHLRPNGSSLSLCTIETWITLERKSGEQLGHYKKGRPPDILTHF